MRRIILLLCLVLSAPSLLCAQVNTRGKIQFGVSGFGSVSENTASLSTQLSLTRFFTKGLEVGGDLQVSTSATSYEGSETTTNTDGYVFGRVRYNFVGQSMTVPYISLGGGTQLTTSETVPTALQAGVGFKRFLSDQVSFNGETNYTSLTAGEYSSSAVNFSFGVSLYVGQ